MKSGEKDVRFTAMYDLMTELEKDSIELGDESEHKMVCMILDLIEDKNEEVQNLAIKCLGQLVKKKNKVETIVNSLCAKMVSNNEQLRQHITGAAIEKQDVSIQLKALDIISDLFHVLVIC